MRRHAAAESPARSRTACTSSRACRTAQETTSEDCLSLNVWTPGLRDGGKRPVMVYFHGGEYSSGS
ncbi:MAG: carboxylesterase family protein, partial [Steroidobacteraceae bacterium]